MSEQHAGVSESTADALERLVYRTGELIALLEKRRVHVPLWTALALERAMTRGREALEREGIPDPTQALVEPDA